MVHNLKKMKKIAVVLALMAGLGFGCSPKSQESASGLDSLGTVAQSENALSPEEQAEGWILLFDGQSMQGWRAFNGDTTPANWIIEEGGGTGIATFTTKLRNDTGIVTCLSFARTGIYSGSTFTGARIGVTTVLSMPSGGFSTSTWAATINPGLAVTVTTSTPHGLVVGNEIGITSIFTGQNTSLANGLQGGVIGQGSPNGSYQVATVGSSTQFTYYVNTAPVGLATTAATAGIASRWEVVVTAPTTVSIYRIA